MTQRQLATAIGVVGSAVSKMEAGARGIGLEDAVAICATLDVSILDMLSPEPLTLTVRIPID